MQRVRARLAEWVALALALFVSSITTPRAGLYFHHHAGGEHLHVHLDGNDTAHDDAHHRHDHDAAAAHHHHHHAHHHTFGVGRAAPSGPGIEAPDDDGTGHWHAQDFFHRAVPPIIFAAHHRDDASVIHIWPKHSLVDRPTLPVRVRGPPRTA